MFIGSYTHTLDTASRFVMPKSFRYSLGERFYITKGMGCLNVLTEDQMREFAQKLEQRGNITESVYNADLSLLQHHFFSGLTEAKIDGQNRLTIPQELKTYADIKSAVTVCGRGNYVEIWGTEALCEYERSVMTPDALAAAAKNVFGKKEDDSVS